MRTGHIERLEEVSEMMGKRSETKPCEATRGIISEGEKTIEDFGQSPAIDAGLVAAGQAVGALRDGALRGSDRLGEAIEYAQSSGSPRRNAAGGKADKLLTQIGATKADKKAGPQRL
jgi:hypothetical protein